MTKSTHSDLRILAIFAHPDDSEFSCGGSAAVWADQGAQITYVVITNGAAGSNDPGQDWSELARIREAEQRAACAILGVQEVRFLGYADGTLEPTLNLRRDLTRIVRQVRPHRVVLGDPSVYFRGNGYINHPDHRAAGEAALYAVFPSAVSRPIFPDLLSEGLEPHQVKEVYMVSDADHVNHYVDITAGIERKIEALRCHKSQLDVGDGQWIRDWATEAGKAGGCDYAEAFRVLTLAREEEA